MNLLFILFILVAVSILVYKLFWKSSRKQLFTGNSKPIGSKQTSTNKFSPNTKTQKVSFEFDESKTGIGKYLIFDLETTGLPQGSRSIIETIDKWPRIIQIAWVILDEELLLVKKENFFIKIPEKIPVSVSKINGITNAKLEEFGRSPNTVFGSFINDLKVCDVLISHNLDFDAKVLEVDLLRNNFPFQLQKKKMICTMLSGKNYFFSQPLMQSKYPKLTELFGKLYFNRIDISIDEAHDAFADTLIAAKCFIKLFEIDKQGVKILKNYRLNSDFYQIG